MDNRVRQKLHICICDFRLFGIKHVDENFRQHNDIIIIIIIMIGLGMLGYVGVCPGQRATAASASWRESNTQ